MTKRLSRLLLVAAVLSTGIALAQFGPRSSSRSRPTEGRGRYVQIEGGNVINEDTVRTARETFSHSTETPNWTNPPGFEHDTFTFARVIFRSDSSPGFRRGGFSRQLGWWVDYPD